MLFWKRTLPLGITFVLGILGALQYYVPHPISEGFLSEMAQWGRIIGGFAMILGVASLCQVHWVKIRRRVPGWGYSAVMYVAMAVTVVFGLRAGGLGGPLVEAGTGFGWIYANLMVALQGSMFSILAFFVASAAYRSFRARTAEATVLLLAATVVMLGRVPFGELLLPPFQFLGFTFPGVGPVADWILTVLNSAARRAILIGIIVGAIATSLKIIFGIERGYLGGGGE
jgi:hypothetical protein